MQRKNSTERGQRFEAVRRRFGAQGSRTTMEGFGRELGLNPKTKGIYRGWELGLHSPQRGLDELAERLARVAAIKRESLDAQRIALWVWLGEGEMPAGAPPLSGPKSASVSDKPIASVRAIVRDIKTGALDEEVAERALLELITSRKRPCFPGGFLRKPLSSALLARDAIISLDDLPRRAFASMSFMRAGGGEDAA